MLDEINKLLEEQKQLKLSLKKPTLHNQLDFDRLRK